MLQDFESVSDHFGTLYINGLRLGNKKNDHVLQDDQQAYYLYTPERFY